MEEFKEGQELTVEPYFEDIPLGEFLRAYTPFDSRRKLQKLVDRGLVEVNGITRPLNFTLQSGDVVEIGEGTSDYEPSYPSPGIVSSTEDLLVLKVFPGQKVGLNPGGKVLGEMDAGEEVLSSGPFEEDEYVFPIYPVATSASGLVCLTNSEKKREKLVDQVGSEQFRLTGKAIVDGVVEDTRRISRPVGSSEHDRTQQEVREDGQEAETIIEKIESYRKFSLVIVQPETAVWDQVRVHLDHIHHPLSVDPRYGYREELNLSEFKTDYREKPFRKERPLIERTTLHWERLEMRSEGIDVQVEEPEDLEITIKQLRNHDQ